MGGPSLRQGWAFDRRWVYEDTTMSWVEELFDGPYDSEYYSIFLLKSAPVRFHRSGSAPYLGALVEYVTDFSFLRPGYLGEGIKKSAPSLRRILTV